MRKTNNLIFDISYSGLDKRNLPGFTHENPSIIQIPSYRSHISLKSQFTESVFLILAYAFTLKEKEEQQNLCLNADKGVMRHPDGTWRLDVCVRVCVKGVRSPNSRGSVPRHLTPRPGPRVSAGLEALYHSV